MIVSLLLSAGRWFRPVPAGSPGRTWTGQRPAYAFSGAGTAGVVLPVDADDGTGSRQAGLGQAFAEGQAGQVGAAAAAGLVPDPVQVGADGAGC